MSNAGAAYLRKLKGIPEKTPRSYQWKYHKSNSAVIRDKAKQFDALIRGHSNGTIKH